MSAETVGSLARQYRLVKRIGQGAMGTVWEAQRIADGRRVALKLLKRELLQEEKALHRFKREAKLSARLGHPNVVATLDAGVDDVSGQPWIAMELVEGPNLAAWVEERGDVPRDVAAARLRDIFSAVRRAHEQNIVHRDLKPENVLLAAGEPKAIPTAKVSDFGIAKGLEEQSWSSTEAGLGTPLWTAPEQAKLGFVPSPRVDVWALGLLTYWLLTGHHYWRHAGPRSSLVDLMLELERAELEPASQRAKEHGVAQRIPPGLDAWFARSVNRRPEERFADAGESWEALGEILGVRGGRHRARLVVLALVALALVALASVATLLR